MTDTLRLAEILCARFCHDFSGVLGSLMGAIELARDEPQANAEALSVGADAAVVLAKRLRLLRAAWAGDCGPLAPAQLAALGEGLSFGKPIRLDLSGLDPGTTFPPEAARLALNVVLLAGECLPHGGTLVLCGSPGSDVIAMIEGPRAAWPPGFAAFLAGEGAAWAALTDPRTAQGPLTALIARAAGLRLSLMMPSGPAAGPAPLLIGMRPGA